MNLRNMKHCAHWTNVGEKVKRSTRLGLQCQTPVRSYPLNLDTYPLCLFPYLLSLIPNPCSLARSTVPLRKFRWGLLLLSLSLSLLLSLLLSKVKVKSTPSLTGLRLKFDNNPHLSFLKGTVLGSKEQGLGIRDKR